MTWQPIVLFGVGGILVGGAASAWKADSRILAGLLAVVAVALVIGGVLWLG